MNLIVKIIVGGIIGYLTGKTVDAEGSVIIRRKPSLADIRRTGGVPGGV